MADSALNQFLSSGSTTDRMAFTPAPPTPASGADLGYLWWDTTLNALYAWDGAAWHSVGGSSVVKIADITTTASQATISFTSIPSTFVHLKLILLTRGTQAAQETQLTMNFNSDTGNNYDWYAQNRFGNASTFATSSITGGAIGYAAGATSPTDNANSSITWLPNYKDTVFHKTAESIGSDFESSSSALITGGAGRWDNTSAITRIDIGLASGVFIDGSRGTLYGYP